MPIKHQDLIDPLEELYQKEVVKQKEEYPYKVDETQKKFVYRITDEHGETNPFKMYLNSLKDENKMEELGFVKNSDGNWTAQPLGETPQEPEDNEWKSVALRFGEELVSIGPCGYYEFTAEEWFDWVVNTYEKICDDTVKLLKKKYPYKKYTPEETEQSLKSAFREAVKQGVVSYTKSPTFYNVIAEWWSDVFTSGCDTDDTETCIDDLVDRIEAFLPKPQSAEGSQNAYVESAVEGFNDCLQQIKSKLR
jgi:hypothetical protein